MKKIKLFSHVRLKDGRQGDVVEVFGDQEAFLVDAAKADPSEPISDDWLPYIKPQDIEEVLWEPND